MSSADLNDAASEAAPEVDGRNRIPAQGYLLNLTEIDVCALEQGRFISWAPEWRPGSRDFPPGQWRFDNAPTGLPGYPDMLQWEVRQGSHAGQTHCERYIFWARRSWLALGRCAGRVPGRTANML